MPKKPKKPCRYPGCPELTDSLYCEEHQRMMNRRYEKYDRNPDTRKRYSRTWKRIRDRYAAENPLCERCFEEGRVVPMEQVHHIIPLSEGGTNEKDNLMSLCKVCHSRIHAERGDRWRQDIQKEWQNTPEGRVKS